MVSGSAARRYAQALFSLGQEQANLGTLALELEQVAALWRESTELRDKLINPLIPLEGRRTIWKTLLDRLGISRLGRSFFQLLFDKGRLVELLAVEREFSALNDRRENRLRAQVTSAVPLSPEVTASLKAILEQKVGKAVMIESQVDPELIGGIVARVGDLMFDGSVRSALGKIKESMISRG